MKEQVGQPDRRKIGRIEVNKESGVPEMAMPLEVRDLTPRDETAWCVLWHASSQNCRPYAAEDVVRIGRLSRLHADDRVRPA